MASGARFAVRPPLNGWVLPGVALPGTHPYTHPGTHRDYRTGVPERPDTRFWDTVGEPRVVEHSPYMGPRTGYIQLYVFARPFDWFYDCFMTGFMTVS